LQSPVWRKELDAKYSDWRWYEVNIVEKKRKEKERFEIGEVGR